MEYMNAEDSARLVVASLFKLSREKVEIAWIERNLQTLDPLQQVTGLASIKSVAQTARFEDLRNELLLWLLKDPELCVATGQAWADKARKIRLWPEEDENERSY